MFRCTFSKSAVPFKAANFLRLSSDGRGGNWTETFARGVTEEGPRIGPNLELAVLVDGFDSTSLSSVRSLRIF